PRIGSISLYTKSRWPTTQFKQFPPGEGWIRLSSWVRPSTLSLIALCVVRTLLRKISTSLRVPDTVWGMMTSGLMLMTCRCPQPRTALGLWQTRNLRPRPDFDGASAGTRNPSSDVDRLIEVLGIYQKVAAELFARFRERAISHEPLAIAHLDTRGGGYGLQRG